MFFTEAELKIIHDAYIQMRNAKARKWFKRRKFVSDNLDAFLTWAASGLKMCGEGPKHNSWLLFAEMWFTDCPCCLFYRGATFGAGLVLSLVALVAGIMAIF